MSTQNPRLAGLSAAKAYPLANSLALYNVQPPKMLIEDFLPAGAIVGVTAAPGTGKTWLTFEVMRSLAVGDLFLGKFRCDRPMSCLFVGSDASVHDYARQWRRLTHDDWKDGDGELNPLEMRSRFLIQSDFLFEDTASVMRVIKTHQEFDSGDSYDIMEYDEEAGMDVPVTVRDTGFKVIVFDTLSKMTRANQNDNTEMEEVFRNIRLIAEQTGATIILLHHNSKRNEFNGGQEWRGAVAQIGALDCWLQLSPGQADRYLINVEYKKFRGITPDGFSYRMKVGEEASASLEYTEPEQVMSRVDHLAIAITTVVKDNYPMSITINNMVDSLADEWLKHFSNDKQRLRDAVRNRVRKMVRTEGSEVVKPIRKTAGGHDVYVWRDKNEQVPNA